VTADDRVAYICRPDAVRLDMTIPEPGGVVAIDLEVRADD